MAPSGRENFSLRSLRSLGAFFFLKSKRFAQDFWFSKGEAAKDPELMALLLLLLVSHQVVVARRAKYSWVTHKSSPEA